MREIKVNREDKGAAVKFDPCQVLLFFVRVCVFQVCLFPGTTTTHEIKGKGKIT